MSFNDCSKLAFTWYPNMPPDVIKLRRSAQSCECAGSRIFLQPLLSQRHHSSVSLPKKHLNVYLFNHMLVRSLLPKTRDKLIGRASHETCAAVSPEDFERAVVCVRECRLPDLKIAWNVLYRANVDIISVFEDDLATPLAQAVCCDSDFGWKALKCLTPALRSQQQLWQVFTGNLEIDKLDAECHNVMSPNVFHYLKWFFRVFDRAVAFAHERGLVAHLAQLHSPQSDNLEMQVFQNISLLVEILRQVLNGGMPQEMRSEIVDLVWCRARRIAESGAEVKAAATRERFLQVVYMLVSLGDLVSTLEFVRSTAYDYCLSLWEPGNEKVCALVAQMLLSMIEGDATGVVLSELQKRQLPGWLLNHLHAPWEVPQCLVMVAFSRLYSVRLFPLLDEEVLRTVLSSLLEGTYLVKTGALVFFAQMAISGPSAALDFMKANNVFSEMLSLIVETHDKEAGAATLLELHAVQVKEGIEFTEEDVLSLQMLANEKDELGRAAELLLQKMPGKE